MALPELTSEQRAAARVKAQEVRAAQAQVAADLRAGSRSLPDVFAAAEQDPDGAVARMKVTSALKALPGWGTVTVSKVMGENKIPEKRRLRGVGTNQRRALEAAANPGQR